jgi:hypothetical protein
MKPTMLLRLYPRAWRERYGDEFLDACGDQSLTFQQVIDIVGGAIDARFAPQAHLAAAGRTEGVPMSVAKAICSRSAVRYTPIDGIKGAAAIIIGSIVLTSIAAVCRANGWTASAQFFKMIAFPASMLLLSPFTFMKGQSAIAKIVILGGTLLVLIAICGSAAFL